MPNIMGSLSLRNGNLDKYFNKMDDRDNNPEDDDIEPELEELEFQDQNIDPYEPRYTAWTPPQADSGQKDLLENAVSESDTNSSDDMDEDYPRNVSPLRQRFERKYNMQDDEETKDTEMMETSAQIPKINVVVYNGNENPMPQ